MIDFIYEKKKSLDKNTCDIIKKTIKKDCCSDIPLNIFFFENKENDIIIKILFEELNTNINLYFNNLYYKNILTSIINCVSINNFIISETLVYDEKIYNLLHVKDKKPICFFIWFIDNCPYEFIIFRNHEIKIESGKLLIFPLDWYSYFTVNSNIEISIPYVLGFIYINKK